MTQPQLAPSLLLRREVMEALRRGVVPRRGLDLFAVGVERFEGPLREELDGAAAGRGVFKAIRGEFGCGKSFLSRWFQQQAMRRGFAVAEVQIAEMDTPLHRLETVYRRAMESLRTIEFERGALGDVLAAWLYRLEDEVVVANPGLRSNLQALSLAVGERLEQRLQVVGRSEPQFAAALRGIFRANVEGNTAVSQGLLAWLSGQPHVGAQIKRYAGLKGEVDHSAALTFLRGVLTVLRETGRSGLLLVLDEVETIQRARADSRERSLNALRQLIDEVYQERFPGLYVLITGTTSFFEGPQGMRSLPPLAQRLHVDFDADPRFDSSLAVQVRLGAFDLPKLIEVGRRVRDLYPAHNTQRIKDAVGDDIIEAVARWVAGELGGQIGIAPRLFLRKLVGDVLDKVDEHPDFDPRAHLKLALHGDELSPEEKLATGRAFPAVGSVDDLRLDFE